MKRLVIISSPEGAAEDERLSELATFLGVPSDVLPFERSESSPRELLNRVRPGPCSLAMHVETLCRVHRALNPGTSFPQLLGDHFPEILVYGVPAGSQTDEALRALTDGTIRKLTLQAAQAVQYSLPREASEFCAQLAGQKLLTRQEHAASAFEIQSESVLVETIIAANEHPMFVRLRSVSRDLFLLADHIPSINKPLSRDPGLGNDCIPLLAPLMFLRRCFPESCWRGGEATARLIIDDPLLTKKYGALDFETLATSIRRFGYGASIAFIPWNHWRSSSSFAARFFGPNSNLSICVHGCDHTNHEFQLGSVSLLAQKAALGIQRMEKHQKRVGVPFEDVMVFPQGQFSKAAIPALRSANYLAAVNSTCFPTDWQAGDLKISDFLWPAVVCFEGFPVFQRRYPHSTIDCALDLFLGKPVLLVEHHEYFRDHCQAMETFVTALRRLEPSLSWPSLSEQLMRSNMRRRNESGSFEIRFFTRRFQFVSKESDEGRYRLLRFEPNPGAVERVLVDGKSVPFGFEKGDLTLEFRAVPGQLRIIDIVNRTAPALPIRSFGAAHNARVLLRRGLSEFRDGSLSQHKTILKVATRFAKALRATGES